MLGQPTIGLVVAVVLTAQDPGGLPGRWGGRPEEAVEIRDPDAEAAEEKRLVESVAKLERLGPDHERLVRPLRELACYFAERERYDEAEPLFRRALAIVEESKGSDHPDVATALIDLAVCRMVAVGKKDDQGGPILARAIAILEKTNRDDPEIARALKTMAGLSMNRHQFDQAEPMLKRALAIQEKTSGADSPEAASLLRELGFLHCFQIAPGVQEIEASFQRPPKGESAWDRHGRLAADYYKRSLAIYERSLEPSHRRIADIVFDLGQLAIVQERWTDAEPYMRRWLKLQEAAKAPPSRKQADALAVLAEAARERKDWAEADRQMERSQRVYARLGGKSNHDVAVTLVGRADLAIETGRFDDAETHLRHALDVEASILGPEHPDIAAARKLLAGSYRDHLDDRLAAILWRSLDLAEFDEETSGKEHWNLANIASTSATLLRRTNRVLPPPTDDDIAYLKKIEALLSVADVSFLQMTRELFPFAIIDDAALEHVGRLYCLERLDAHRVTDAGLAHIKDLVNLQDLKITGAGITDAGLEHLAGLESLRTLYLAGTKVTEEGEQRLRKRRPNLQIYNRDRELMAPSSLVPTRPAPEVTGAPAQPALPGLPRPGGPMPATRPDGPAPGNPGPPR